MTLFSEASANGRHKIVIALLIGLIVGALAGSWYVKENFTPHWNGRGGDFKRHMLEHFSSELSLTPEQKEEVGAIFEKNRPQMMALQAEMRPKFEALRNLTHEEIRKILTPEQQKKFDVMSARFEKRFKDHRGGPFFRQ